MLSPTAPIFGNLASATSRALAGLQRSVGRALRSGNAVASMRDAGDGGQFGYASRLEAGTQAKDALLEGMQNAVTYVQMQEAGLSHVEQVYERMSTLAAQAMDTLMDHGQRQTLNEEFDSLKKELEYMRTETFQDKYLYDDMAAWTVQNVDFSDGLDEKQKPAEVDSDGTKRWISKKDVLYTSGKITLEVNSGKAAERYYVKQGNTVIFDTGDWKTEGSAYEYDFDSFVIEFAPGKDTTFEFVPSTLGDDTDSRGAKKNDPSDDIPLVENKIYDNEPFYTKQLGVGGTAELIGQTFTNKGQVRTAPATGESTEISIVVESTTLFQASAKYEQTGPTNYIDVGEETLGSTARLDPVGFGVLSDASIATVADAASTLEKVGDEIVGVGVQLGKLGGNMAELQMGAESISQQVMAGKVGLARMTDDLLATEVTRMAKERMKVDSRMALMVQARGVSRNLIGTLLQ